MLGQNFREVPQFVECVRALALPCEARGRARVVDWWPKILPLIVRWCLLCAEQACG
jgi:hypothetical protein